ncbi:MAG TPA: hypothetical protein VL098_08645 [Flavipsychrobacter sp.]|nr:hypothetical protein [Flavipsychrobacter sp.]
MKKLILSALALTTIATAQAQKPGSILIYGSLGVGGNTTTYDAGIPGVDDSKTKDFNMHFAPGIGYQFNKNWTVGLNFGVGLATSTNVDADVDVINTGIMIGPFIRHTMPINKTFFMFTQANLGYMYSMERTDYNDAAIDNPESYVNGVGIDVFPAVGINITKCIALNFSIGGLGVASTKQTFNDAHEMGETAEIRNVGVDFTLGQQFNLGVSANLGGRHGKAHRDPGMEHRRHMDMDDDADVEIKVKKKKVNVEDEE